jgi:hypothetical protein
MSTYCCDGCLKDVVSCLTDGALRVNLSGLIDGQTYIAVITDQQGKSYGVPFTWGADNFVDLPIGTDEGEIPPSLFNIHIGPLKFEVQSIDGACVAYQFSQWTKCVELEVLAHFPAAYEKDEIGLEIA